MAFDGVAQRLTSRRGIGRLKLGTTIGGAAVMLLVPAMSRAATVPTSYSLAAPTLVSPSLSLEVPARSVQTPVPVLPQDLTVRPAAVLAPVSHLAAADVYVHDGDITTSGDYTPGIVATSSGALKVVAGTVTTNGNYSDGIDATAAGPIAITVSGVTTSGNQSRGIYAVAGGDIDIDAGTIATNGTAATGIYAKSKTGDVTINAGSVTSLSPGAVTGIYAYGHNVDVTADSVTAYEQAKLRTVGIVAIGVGDDADVKVTLCGSAWKKDPVSGVIGVEKGPLIPVV